MGGNVSIESMLPSVDFKKRCDLLFWVCFFRKVLMEKLRMTGARVIYVVLFDVVEQK